MFLGKVIGNVWATKKYEALNSFKLLFVQPINADNQELGEPIIAVDTVGAGPGEIIFYITASEAVIPLPVIWLRLTLQSLELWIRSISLS